MNLTLPSLHADIVELVRRFAASELSPRAGAIEEGALEPGVVRGFAELDLWGLTLPEGRGGAGLDALAFGLVVEALAAASPSFAWRYAAHAGPACAALGQTSHDLSRVTAGELASFALADSWAPAPESFFVRGEAGACEVFAADEIAVDPVSTMGLRGAGLARIATRGAGVAAGDVTAWLDLAAAATMVGAATGATQAAADYVKERKQFGQPLASFQAVAFAIADARVGLEAASLLVRRASVALDAGDPNEASVARRFAARAASSATSSALQLHGGYGYTKEYPVERQLRAVRMLAADGERSTGAIAARVFG